MLIYRCGDHILNVDGKPDAILFFFFFCTVVFVKDYYFWLLENTSFSF